MGTAARVRESKEKHPADYCPDRRCLWQVRLYGGTTALTRVNPCRHHPHLMAKCEAETLTGRCSQPADPVSKLCGSHFSGRKIETFSPARCDVCGDAAWVMVRSSRLSFAGFRCAAHLAETVEKIIARNVSYTIDRLANRANRSVMIEGVDVERYAVDVIDGLVGDAGPFDDQNAARLAVEASLADRLRRPLEREEQITVAAATAIEWQRRARETREQASDWLYDFQQA